MMDCEFSACVNLVIISLSHTKVLFVFNTDQLIYLLIIFAIEGGYTLLNRKAGGRLIHITDKTLTTWRIHKIYQGTLNYSATKSHYSKLAFFSCKSLEETGLGPLMTYSLIDWLVSYVDIDCVMADD